MASDIGAFSIPHVVPNSINNTSVVNGNSIQSFPIPIIEPSKILNKDSFASPPTPFETGAWRPYAFTDLAAAEATITQEYDVDLQRNVTKLATTNGAATGYIIGGFGGSGWNKDHEVINFWVKRESSNQSTLFIRVQTANNSTSYIIIRPTVVTGNLYGTNSNYIGYNLTIPQGQWVNLEINVKSLVDQFANDSTDTLIEIDGLLCRGSSTDIRFDKVRTYDTNTVVPSFPEITQNYAITPYYLNTNTIHQQQINTNANLTQLGLTNSNLVPQHGILSNVTVTPDLLESTNAISSHSITAAAYLNSSLIANSSQVKLHSLSSAVTLSPNKVTNLNSIYQQSILSIKEISPSTLVSNSQVLSHEINAKAFLVPEEVSNDSSVYQAEIESQASLSPNTLGSSNVIHESYILYQSTNLFMLAPFQNSNQHYLHGAVATIELKVEPLISISTIHDPVIHFNQVIEQIISEVNTSAIHGASLSTSNEVNPNTLTNVPLIHSHSLEATEDVVSSTLVNSSQVFMAKIDSLVKLSVDLISNASEIHTATIVVTEILPDILVNENYFVSIYDGEEYHFDVYVQKETNQTVHIQKELIIN